MGGRLRLRSSPLPPDPIRGSLVSPTTRSDPGGSSSTGALRCMSPPKFQPDRAACLAFAAGARLRHRLRLGRPQAGRRRRCRSDRLRHDGTPLLSFHVARAQPAAGSSRNGRTPWLMAVNGAGRLCVGRLVRLAGSGADLAVSERAPDRAGGGDVGRRTRPRISTRSAPTFESCAGAEAGLDRRQDAGRAARGDEEGDRRA